MMFWKNSFQILEDGYTCFLFDIRSLELSNVLKSSERYEWKNNRARHWTLKFDKEVLWSAAQSLTQKYDRKKEILNDDEAKNIIDKLEKLEANILKLTNKLEEMNPTIEKKNIK